MLWLTRAGDDWWETVPLPVAEFGAYAGVWTSAPVSGERLETVLVASSTAAVLLTQQDGHILIDGHDVTASREDAIASPPRAEEVPVGEVELPRPRQVPHVRGGWAPVIAEVDGLHVRVPGDVACRFHAREIPVAPLSRCAGGWYLSATTPVDLAGLTLWVLGRVQVL